MQVGKILHREIQYIGGGGLVTKLCLNLCNHMDCSLLQAPLCPWGFLGKNMEWAAIFICDLPDPGAGIAISCTASGLFTLSH